MANAPTIPVRVLNVTLRQDVHEMKVNILLGALGVLCALGGSIFLRHCTTTGFGSSRNDTSRSNTQLNFSRPDTPNLSARLR